jgi:Spy/CpxP family protein refolding chaperone
MKTKTFQILLIAVGLALFGKVARAEDKLDVKPEAAPAKRRLTMQDRLKQLSTQLNLTDEQKEKLKPMLQEEFVKVRELRQNDSLSREDKAAKLKELRTEMQKKIEPVLTPEQKEKWAKMQQRRLKRQEKG